MPAVLPEMSDGSGPQDESILLSVGEDQSFKALESIMNTSY